MTVDYKPEIDIRVLREADVDVLFMFNRRLTSNRAFNCLRQMGVKTVGEVMALEDYELLRQPNAGRKTLVYIRKAVSEYLVGPWDDKGFLIYPPHEQEIC